MISNDNKTSIDDIAPARPLVVSSEEAIERMTANRAQMQTEVAAESGVDESYAVHAYHCLFFNPRTSAVPPRPRRN